MYGWRGRIGVIIPADNAVMEPEFYHLAPLKECRHTRHGSRNARGPKCPSRRWSWLKPSMKPTSIWLPIWCAASSFVMGPKGNEELCENLSDITGGLPCVTATTAMVDGLKAIGAKRVAVLSPHPPEIAEKLKGYLEESGFEIPSLLALGLDIPAINNTSPGDIYRHVRSMDLSNVDAIFIAATNFRAIDVIEAIEADIGLPVVSSNQVRHVDRAAQTGYRG